MTIEPLQDSGVHSPGRGGPAVDREHNAFFDWVTDISPAAAAERNRIDAAVAGIYDCCDDLTAQAPELVGRHRLAR